MKKLLYLILLICLPLATRAQETIDVLSLSARYGLPAEFQDAAYAGQSTELGAINSLTAGFDIAENTMVVVNVNHFYFNIRGDVQPEFPMETAYPLAINGILLRAGLRQYFDNGRMVQVLAVPRLMSDFRNMDGRSFQFGAVASYSRVHSDRLTLGFGAIYNGELFGAYFVPILDVNWKFGERWRLKGMIPVTARVEYTVNENMLVGFNHFGLITSYALGDEAYAGDYMERQSIDLSLFARHRIAGNIFAEFMAGRALGRSYHQYEGDQKVKFAIPLVAFGDERVLKNEYADFGSGFIFTLKLIYNMPLPE